MRSVQKGRVQTYKQVKGTFYVADLQKVTVEDDDLFRIDKIVKHKGDKSWCTGKVGQTSMTL